MRQSPIEAHEMNIEPPMVMHLPDHLRFCITDKDYSEEQFEKERKEDRIAALLVFRGDFCLQDCLIYFGNNT